MGLLEQDGRNATGSAGTRSGVPLGLLEQARESRWDPWTKSQVLSGHWRWGRCRKILNTDGTAGQILVRRLSGPTARI